MTVIDPLAPHLLQVDAQRIDGQMVLHLGGELDSVTVPKLRRLVDGLEVEGDVLLDLSQLSFVDSMGLGCLFRLQQRVADAGGLLVARGACPPVRHAIQMVQLNRVMALLD